MMDRCRNPASKDYPNWGGRGISVYAPWHDITVFIAEVEAQIGPKPSGRFESGRPRYTLDRVNNERNYEPGNIRWATSYEQVHNSRAHKLSRLGGTTAAERANAAQILRRSGMSQKDIAAALGVSQASVVNYLREPL
jgi:hypothetical protein